VLVLGGGAVASTQLSSLLTNSFDVPGTASARAAKVLAAHFGERPEGTFIVVFPVRQSYDPVLRARLQQRLARAARAVPGGHTAFPLRSGGGLLYGEVATRLDFQHAKRYTDRLRRALRRPGPPALVTGEPAIQRDLDPILTADLHRAELVAVPFALLVLVLLLGPLPAVAIPFLVAACTVAGTLAGVYGIAHGLPTTSFVTNLVTLIGLGLAVDYSLLVAHRFREELQAGAAVDDAVARTMATAGRAVAFSGATVAAALGMLVLVPVPFIRSLGACAVLVPVLSITAALTLQPVLLAAFGAVGLRPRRALGHRFWSRLAPFVVRRRGLALATSAAVLVAVSLPALALELVPASFAGLPVAPESARALALLRDGVAPGAVTPMQIVVDAAAPGRARAGPERRAIARLAGELVKDPEALVVASGTRPPYVDATGRYARVFVVGRHEYGAPQERALVHRLRARLVLNAHFPADTEVDAGGAPAQGADFLSTTYSAFPWLVLAVVAVTLVALLAAFRSVVLPLTAVVTNLLPVAAAYGVLVLVAQWGVGAGLLGVQHAGHVEGWIPIFLFATLFGLSTDYEVFLVMRMRESWEHRRDNDHAVEVGLERTGPVITAAALIMAAAFAGFVAGRVPGLQQLGLGLTTAVLVDATVVRTCFVPALIGVIGPRSWWSPGARRAT
jgi:putative drug exporter of the RND superfamily